jgi:hypothetical protein
MIKVTTKRLNVPTTVELRNHLRKRTGKAPGHNSIRRRRDIHLKDSMTSMRKTTTDMMIMAMVMGRTTMISTSSQYKAGELVRAGRIHNKIKATLRNKNIIIMVIRDHKIGILAEVEVHITVDHQGIIVEGEVDEAILIVMVRL